MHREGISPIATNTKMKTETPITEFVKVSDTGFRFKDKVRGFFTFEDLKDIETIIKKLRKGVKRWEDFPPITVLIDGSRHEFKTIPMLRKLLVDCTVMPDRFEIFRNMGKGITLDFDKVLKR